MKKLISIFIIAFFALTSLPVMQTPSEAKATKKTHVRGYSKKNGHYVNAHSRKTPTTYKKRKRK